MGYLATALLALSLLVNNDLKFRWWNSLGCVAFIVYGLLIHALPVVFTNLLLLGINIFYLIKIYKRSESFDIVPFQWSDPIVEKFLTYYEQDIQQFFPAFDRTSMSGSIRFMVLRNMDLASVFVATVITPGVAEIKIDYTIPRYRDYKVGRYIFEKGNLQLHQHHVHTLVYDRVPNQKHLRFIELMGFEKGTNGQYFFRLHQT